MLSAKGIREAQSSLVLEPTAKNLLGKEVLGFVHKLMPPRHDKSFVPLPAPMKHQSCYYFAS